MTFFAKDINKGLEEAIEKMLWLDEGKDLVMSEYLDNRVRRAASKQREQIKMSLRYRFAVRQHAPEFRKESPRKPKYKRREDLSEPTFYDQAGVHIASLVPSRRSGYHIHPYEPNCKETGHRLYLLDDGSLAVFSYIEEHSEEELVSSEDGVEMPYAIATYTAKLEKLFPKQQLISATDEWLATAYIFSDNDPNKDPHIALSSEDPAKCIYWFKHEADQEPGQTRGFLMFDKGFLVGGMDAALDSEDDKATVLFDGEYGQGVYARDGPIPKPEREACIYLEVYLRGPAQQRYVAGEATEDYYRAKLKRCCGVKELEPSGG